MELSIFTFIVSIVLAGVCLRWPEVPVAVLLVGMSVWDLLPYTFSAAGFRMPLTAFAALMSLTLHWLFRRDRSKVFKFVGTDVWLFGFVLYSGLSLLWSENAAYGAWKWALFSFNVLVLSLLARAFYTSFPERFPSLVWCVSVVSLIPIWHVFRTTFEVAGVAGLNPAEFYSTRRNAIDQVTSLYGASEALTTGAIVGAFAALISRSRFAKGIGMGLAWLALWGGLLLGQRSHFSAVAAGISLLVVLWGKSASVRPILIIFAVGILGVGILVQAKFNPRASVDYITDDNSVAARILAFQVAIEAFTEAPIGGVGLGDYAEFVTRNSAEGEVGTLGNNLALNIVRKFPHNVPLEILAELGVLGFGLFTGWVASLIRHTRRSLRLGSDLRGPFAFAVAWVTTRTIISMVSGDLAMVNIGIPVALIYAYGRARPVNEVCANEINRGAVQHSGGGESKATSHFTAQWRS